MKGKLSRMWRSGLSMMLALIMMFSLGTVAFATEGSASETEDVSVVAQAVADVFKHYADAEKAEALAKYAYASFEEQGYITLIVKALEEAEIALDKAIAEVEYVIANLSPELKAEVKTALVDAKAAVVDLKNTAMNAENLDSDITKAELKAAAEVATQKLAAAKTVVAGIIDAATKEDAKLVLQSALKAIDAAMVAAEKLFDLLVAVIKDATSETINVPCGGYNVVALGDGSVSGYAALVAKALGANLNDLSAANKEAGDDKNINNAAIANADVVLMGYGFDGITDYVASQLSTTDPDVIDWAAVVDAIDVDKVDAALAAVEAKLIGANVSSDEINLTMVALESYAYAYAKYLLDYPLVVKDIQDVNEDALVIVVGVYNPLEGVVVNAGNVSVDLGLFMDVLVDATDLYNLASAILISDCIFVEANAVATALEAGDMSTAELAYTLIKGSDAMLPTAEGAEYIKTQIMNALTVVNAGHVATAVSAVAPTCTEDGLTEGTKCAVCGAVLEAQEVVPALGHDWDNGVVGGADKYLKTLITYTCQRCGETKTEAYDKMHYFFFAGYPDGSFGTERSITREEVAVVFYAMLNDNYQVADDAFVYEGKYTDVAEGEWYTKAVEVLSKLGVVAGYPDGSFGVGKAITRAEFATMAVAIGQFEIDGTVVFPDVAEGHWFYDFVRTAVNNGCVAGYPDGNFKPNQAITRAEAAVIACNMAGRPYECAKEYFDHYSAAGQIPVDVELNSAGEVVAVNEWASIKVLSDVANHWAYYWLVEASNTHYHEVGLS